MADPKGLRLYVNIGASQARRRLKGFGHGVKQVQSTGKNQSVIIHSATGRHLEELEAVFSDAMLAGCEEDLGIPVQNLRNLGPTSAAWLREINVHTKADLQRFGSALAYRLVKQRRPKTSLNLLWAMAAGLVDRDWRELSEEEKEKLLAEIKEK